MATHKVLIVPHKNKGQGENQLLGEGYETVSTVVERSQAASAEGNGERVRSIVDSVVLIGTRRDPGGSA